MEIELISGGLFSKEVRVEVLGSVSVLLLVFRILTYP
jgi:hypothetical protein